MRRTWISENENNKPSIKFNRVEITLLWQSDIVLSPLALFLSLSVFVFASRFFNVKTLSFGEKMNTQNMYYIKNYLCSVAHKTCMGGFINVFFYKILVRLPMRMLCVTFIKNQMLAFPSSNDLAFYHLSQLFQSGNFLPNVFQHALFSEYIWHNIVCWTFGFISFCLNV